MAKMRYNEYFGKQVYLFVVEFFLFFISRIENRLPLRSFFVCFLLFYSVTVLAEENKERKQEDLLFQLVTTREELRTVRYELSELIKEYESLRRNYESVKLSVAGILEKADIKPPTQREKDLLRSLKIVCRYANRLVETTEKFCDFLEKNFANDKEIDKVLRLQMKLRIRELKGECENIKLLTALKRPTPPPGVSRILEINNKNGHVLISVGFVNGVRCGLIWYAANKQKTKLKVVWVGKWLSVAIVTQGSLSDLEEGMLLTNQQK